MKKIQNKMHILGERIQEYGVGISSFYLFQLNNSTSQQLNILVFPYSPGATMWHEGLSLILFVSSIVSHQLFSAPLQLLGA